MYNSNPADVSQYNTYDIIETFKQAMLTHGLVCDDINPDGNIHRFKQAGDTGTPGWYCLYQNDGISVGFYGCFKRNIHEKWCSRELATLNPQQQAEYQKQLADAQKKQQAAKEAYQQQVAVCCQNIWQQASHANDTHPYLQQKQVSAIGLRQSGDSLIVPLCNEHNELVNLQFIQPDGKKRFKKGGRKQGCFFSIGHLTAQIYIVEGVATGLTVHQATHNMAVVAFDAGNLAPVANVIKRLYPKVVITIAGDNDWLIDPNVGAIQAKQAAQQIGARCVVPQFKEGVEGSDFNDLFIATNIDTVKQQLETSQKTPLMCQSVRDFLQLKLNPRTNIVDPWLPQPGLAMVYAPRGIGKTHFALTLAYAICCGSDCFQWTIHEPKSVLYLDGEMPAIAMQDRLAKLVASQAKEPIKPLRFITKDLNPLAHLSLSDCAGQQTLDSYLENTDLIIVDNISTLCPGKENDAESWQVVQQWLLRMRSAGRSVCLIHHAGKGGQQRGTSKREDILDTVIALKRPASYSPQQGAVFEIHFEKSRGFSGDEAQPMLLSLEEIGQSLQWKVETVEQSTFNKVIDLHREGSKPIHIAEELGINKSTVSRHLKRAKTEGFI